mmetsp:Transcript_9424/g.19518  ORF Transcript_9424/g.19518 Transcript_9424/m.19518 type:complete len:690 (+) Transcript_9424:254-2323(+)
MWRIKMCRDSASAVASRSQQMHLSFHRSAMWIFLFALAAPSPSACHKELPSSCSLFGVLPPSLSDGKPFGDFCDEGGSASLFGEVLSRGHHRRRHKRKRRKSKSSPSLPLHELRCGADGISDGDVDGEDSNSFENSSIAVAENEESLIDVNIVDKENDAEKRASDVETTNELAESNVSLQSQSEFDDSEVDGLKDSDEDVSKTERGDILTDSSKVEVSESEISDDVERNDAENNAKSDTNSDDVSLELILEQQSKLRSSASERRAEGKILHDAGDLSDAVEAFRHAASLLDEAISLASEHSIPEEDADAIGVERATCRLHEALCLLKDGRPRDCIDACSDVLGDGVAVVEMDEEEVANDVNDDDAGTHNESQATAAVVKIITAPNSETKPFTRPTISPIIRARAHHRRAKARLALGDLDGALEDARSAAFMGDRNAVAFYGRLMREGSGAGDKVDGGVGSSPLGWGNGMGDKSSNPFLDGILGGNSNNPFMPSMGAGSSDFSTSLLSSLLKSDNDNGGGSNPFGLMGELLAPSPTNSSGKSKRRKGKKKGGGMDSLAKSVLSNLMKKIEDEETQEQICRYLHSTNKQQVIQFSAMAGVPMTDDNASRLVSFANGITPKGISRNISRVKRGLKVFKTVRKILKVLDKYKPVIILVILCYWIRSAIVEPYPVSKKQAKKIAQMAAESLVIG